MSCLCCLMFFRFCFCKVLWWLCLWSPRKFSLFPISDKDFIELVYLKECSQYLWLYFTSADWLLLQSLLVTHHIQNCRIMLEAVSCSFFDCVSAAKLWCSSDLISDSGSGMKGHIMSLTFVWNLCTHRHQHNDKSFLLTWSTPYFV